MTKLDELKLSLQKLLDEETKGRESLPRLIFLAEHLEEYIYRWKGFVDTELVPFPSMFQGSMYEVIKAGVEVIDSELQAANISIQNELDIPWKVFKIQLTKVQETKNPNDIEDLIKDCGAFKERCKLSGTINP
jgi:hypothetical protein